MYRYEIGESPDQINTRTTALQDGENVDGLVYFFAPGFCIGRIKAYGKAGYVVVEFLTEANEIDGTALAGAAPDMSGEWLVLLPSLLAGRTYDAAISCRDTLGRE